MKNVVCIEKKDSHAEEYNQWSSDENNTAFVHRIFLIQNDRICDEVLKICLCINE